MPQIDLVRREVLEGITFHLVEANIRWNDQWFSKGWGRAPDLETAKWKAIGEAIERHCFEILPHVVSARAAELSRWIHPDRIIRYVAQQFDQGPRGLDPFNVDQNRLWVLAQPVSQGEPTHVLADLICSPRAFSEEYRERLTAHCSTSGCASADQLDLAILRAVMELIERDACMRHWFSQEPGRTIDPRTLSPEMHHRMCVLERHGCKVGLQWLDLGLHPVWMAWAQHPELHFTCVGTATGLSGEAALEAAVSELETVALARACGVPALPILPANVRTPADHGALYATEHYFRHADLMLRTDGALWPMDEAMASFEASPQEVYVGLKQRGYPPYWVDLSVEEALAGLSGRAIHTVRAVVPGLIPLVFGYGRLPYGMDEWKRTGIFDIHPFT